MKMSKLMRITISVILPMLLLPENQSLDWLCVVKKWWVEKLLLCAQTQWVTVSWGRCVSVCCDFSPGVWKPDLSQNHNKPWKWCGQHSGSKEIYFKDLSTRLILFLVRGGDSPTWSLSDETLIMFDLLRLDREWRVCDVESQCQWKCQQNNNDYIIIFCWCTEIKLWIARQTLLKWALNDTKYRQFNLDKFNYFK